MKKSNATRKSKDTRKSNPLPLPPELGLGGCVVTEQDVQKRLSDKDVEERLRHVDNWIANEKDELKFNIRQAHELLELKDRLEIMTKSIDTPLGISQENMLARERRQGAELMHDAVEESLLKEIDTLRKNEGLLHEGMEQLNSQISQLRAIRHEMETDIQNKEEARKNDECIKLLSKLATEIGGMDVVQSIPTVNPMVWNVDTQALIQSSQEERNSSQLCYCTISKSMISSADECFNVWYETNAAFNARIAELVKARQNVLKQLQKVLQDIENLSQHLAKIRKVLEEKLAQLQEAQAKLDKRKQRPGLELCRDKTMIALYREIYALKQGIELLQKKLAELEATMAQLLRTKSTMEREIKLKEVALLVDRDKCLLLRYNFPISTFKETRYPKKQDVLIE